MCRPASLGQRPTDETVPCHGSKFRDATSLVVRAQEFLVKRYYSASPARGTEWKQRTLISYALSGRTSTARYSDGSYRAWSGCEGDKAQSPRGGTSRHRLRGNGIEHAARAASQHVMMSTSIVRAPGAVAQVVSGQRRESKAVIRSPRRYKHWAHSGNPAFRRPSISSFAFDRPPRAMNPEIVKAGSVSSTRAAPSRASASRPRWAKADARQQ